MSDISSHTILCGSCQCAAKTVENPQPHDQVVCPRCGRSDRLDNVLRIVKEHVSHSTAEMLHNTLAEAMRGSKFIKLTSQRPSKRAFRWVAGNYGG